MLKNVLRYFAQGILITVPGIITFFVLMKAFSFIYETLNRFKLNIHPFLDPILILLVLISLLVIVGRLANSILFKSSFDLFEKILEHAPVVKHIYSPVKDFLNAFVGNKKKFTKPVLVLTNPASGIEEIGFLTMENLKDLGLNNKVAVYMPHSYAFSGKLVIVPKENIRILEISGGDAMKFIVSGGLAEVNEEGQVELKNKN